MGQYSLQRFLPRTAGPPVLLETGLEFFIHMCLPRLTTPRCFQTRSTNKFQFRPQDRMHVILNVDAPSSKFYIYVSRASKHTILERSTRPRQHEHWSCANSLFVWWLLHSFWMISFGDVIGKHGFAQLERAAKTNSGKNCWSSLCSFHGKHLLNNMKDHENSQAMTMPFVLPEK